jgi:hypothetical protein
VQAASAQRCRSADGDRNAELSNAKKIFCAVTVLCNCGVSLRLGARVRAHNGGVAAPFCAHNCGVAELTARCRRPLRNAVAPPMEIETRSFQMQKKSFVLSQCYAVTAVSLFVSSWLSQCRRPLRNAVAPPRSLSPSGFLRAVCVVTNRTRRPSVLEHQRNAVAPPRSLSPSGSEAATHTRRGDGGQREAVPCGHDSD